MPMIRGMCIGFLGGAEGQPGAFVNISPNDFVNRI